MTRDTPPTEGDEQATESRTLTSRRRFLEIAGAAGVTSGIGGFAMAQQDQPTEYRFGGRTSGWIGRSPPEIEGESNPTVDLKPGTQYSFFWENVDGAPHNMAILDAQGNVVERTEIISEEGATQTLTFTATEEMSTYYCQVHPTSMRGNIEIVGAGTPATEQQTPTPAQQRFVPRGPSVGAELLIDGPLVNPVVFRSVPGMEDTHVIVDQPGVIYLFQQGGLPEEPFLDITDRVMMLADTDGGFDRPEGFDERGLLGMEFHPNFQENGRFFLRYSSAEAQSAGEGLVGPGDRGLPESYDHVAVLSEFQMAGGGGQLRADPGSERVLLEVPEPQFNHNGGEVMFGQDGYLYTTLGDGGDANDTGLGHSDDWYADNEGGNGQDVTENLLGSVLRIDVDQQSENKPYAVPEDNPLVGTEGLDELYAWGLRNPWRASFNDGQLITGDVGQSLFEEVDVIEKGGNYGWNVREGFHCFDAANAVNPPEQCPNQAPQEAPYNGQSLADPVAEYPHTYQGNQVGISITGGYVYQGDQLSELTGQYIFGDWSQSFTKPQGRIFVANPEAGGAPETGTPTALAPDQETNATETDVVGNVSVGQEAENRTAVAGGNETTGTPTAQDIPDVDLVQPSDQPWPYQEVVIEGGENQVLNRFIQAFGRDDQGNVYVLASTTGRLTGKPGQVYRLVPPGQGGDISQPELETPTPGAEAAENETAGNETNATMADGNETAGNQTNE